MREPEFLIWLENDYKTANGTRMQKRPRGDAKSRCKRVENHEGDLDLHFSNDKMQMLIKKLTYSRADESFGTLPKHNIFIDGNLVKGTASLCSAIKLYQQFCIEHSRNTKIKFV